MPHNTLTIFITFIFCSYYTVGTVNAPSVVSGLLTLKCNYGSDLKLFYIVFFYCLEMSVEKKKKKKRNVC